MRRVDYYFAVWAIVLPISSVVVLPFVQGTTPAYIMALSLPLPFVSVLVFRPEEMRRYYLTLGILCLVFVTLSVLAQLALSFSGVRHLWKVQLVDPLDESIVLRRTMFTQSFYLLAAASTFVFVRHFYHGVWDRYAFAGATFVACYGIYEVCYFFVFRSSGDFLTNRTFGGGYWPGSLVQTISLGPLALQRLKSLTGEPSMYAFTMLPFWIYAVHTHRKWIQWVLLVSLLLTTSTTAVVGIGLYLAMRFAKYHVRDRLNLVVMGCIVALVVLGFTGNQFVLAFYEKIIGGRLNLSDQSSLARYGSLLKSMQYFVDAPLANQLFGLGFGYARASNMFSTVLVNLGVVGLLLVCCMFLRPIFALGWDERSLGIKAALMVIFVTMMLSVPEFSYLSTWLFLGMGYHEMGKRAKENGTQIALNGDQVTALRSGA